MELLKKLCSCPAVCGNEEQIRELIKKEIDLEYTEDNPGNLVFHKKGEGESIVIALPLDTPGGYITHIDDKGFLRFSPVGGFTPAENMHVILKSGRYGVIGKDKNDELFIDIGAKDFEEAQTCADVSDFFAPSAPVNQSGDMLTAFAAGSRAAIAAVIEVAKAHTKRDVYFAFVSKCSTPRQIAPVFLKSILPQSIITVETARANDIPAEKNVFISLGGGAVIKVKDASLLSSPDLLQEIYAKTADMKVQREVSEDRGIGEALQTAYKPLRCAGISIPTRYKGSLTESVCMSDIQSLTEAIVRILN